MRLLDVGTKKLHTFIESKIPPYAILSHTWLKDDEEVTFAQIQQPERCQHMLGYHKIEFLCQQAAKDGFQYAWIDTCCIDKTSSAELSEAINSMFRWYEKAERCYALLSDIDNSEEQSFLTSRWWSRAWTLQELLAPTTVDFFDRNWCLIGKKSDLAESIEKSTGISCKVLRSQPLHHSSVAQRMSWASKRVATRSEDVAYSLFGIFGVNMPLLYGEGERAFLRLQQEVLETSGDHSLFAWNFDSDLIFEQKLMPCSITFPNSGGLFAASPSQFSTCGRIVFKHPRVFTITLRTSPYHRVR
ncbi:HET-domain-containing protein [Byssothecium circinans]|uniref:HET-domain-containing protein n=1 Tax=Byssothecium circinans TaxID=147558 RepID=A0A6A5TRE8_9PLEO|nr:HET-domain-containing protein [Byssothecium circinans]